MASWGYLASWLAKGWIPASLTQAEITLTSYKPHCHLQTEVKENTNPSMYLLPTNKKSNPIPLINTPMIYKMLHIWDWGAGSNPHSPLISFLINFKSLKPPNPSNSSSSVHLPTSTTWSCTWITQTQFHTHKNNLVQIKYFRLWSVSLLSTQKYKSEEGSFISGKIFCLT